MGPLPPPPDSRPGQAEPLGPCRPEGQRQISLEQALAEAPPGDFGGPPGNFGPPPMSVAPMPVPRALGIMQVPYPYLGYGPPPPPHAMPPLALGYGLMSQRMAGHFVDSSVPMAGPSRRRRRRRRSMTRSGSSLSHSPRRRRPGGLKRKPRMKLKKKPPPDPEPLVEEQPLVCGGIEGPLAQAQSFAGWECVLADQYRRSFVAQRKKAFTESTLKEWFAMLEQNIRWNRPRAKRPDDDSDGRVMPRHACWLTAKGCRCTYQYGGTHWDPVNFPVWFEDITDRVIRTCGLKERPNCCNVNLYEDGMQWVGWHADDEVLFDAVRNDALIMSLSLGQSRCFELHPMDDPQKTTTMVLENGDLCTMEGLTQKHYRHRVPREEAITGPRINLTWRWIRKHQSECPSKRLMPH